jgi:hypothetical protein
MKALDPRRTPGPNGRLLLIGQALRKRDPNGIWLLRTICSSLAASYARDSLRLGDSEHVDGVPPPATIGIARWRRPLSAFLVPRY